jgi:hypothetical protein
MVSPLIARQWNEGYDERREDSHEPRLPFENPELAASIETVISWRILRHNTLRMARPRRVIPHELQLIPVIGDSSRNMWKQNEE